MMPAQQLEFECTLSVLLSGFATVPVQHDVGISALVQHSDQVQCGDLFVALAGGRTHGLKHLDAAIQRGAVAVLWEPHSNQPGPDALCSIPHFAIPQLGRYVGVLADRFYRSPSRDMTVIGVTGTDGKTSVSQFLAQCLHSETTACGVIGTLGYGIHGDLHLGPHTTPQAIQLQSELSLMRSRGAKTVVMEASSHGLEQGRLNGTAFDVAVLTHLNRDHLDYHGDLNSYAAAKRRLFEFPGLSWAILNLDDVFGQSLAERFAGKPELLGYSLAGGFKASEIPQIRTTRMELGGQGMRLEVDTPWGQGELRSALLGRFNAENLLATVAVLLALGFSLKDALQRLAGAQPVRGRMESFGGVGQPLVVVDYAHTPGALNQVLRALRSHCRGRLWCVFGCGGDRDAGKRPQMARVAEQLADRLIITDDNPRHEAPGAIVRDMLAGLIAPQAVQVIHDRGRAIATAIQQAGPNDVVLVAGKGHEEVQLIGGQTVPFSDRQQVSSWLG
jgi:UDP-N-acetylmuramoyl-L-alanyl-D-glutamate--2,6-diaminopimelate ligase